jgi:hypothetical protein
MYFAVEDVWYPGRHWCTEDEQKQRRSDYEFGQVWHFTRDPRRVVPSLASIWLNQGVWSWQERHTGVSCGIFPKKLRAMKHWVAWNELIEKNEKIDLFFRVEDIDNHWAEICERLGVTDGRPVPAIERDLGSVPDKSQTVVPMTWDEMKSIDNETYERVFEMAVRYGYEE